MAELNLKQIIDRLNEEFIGDTRKLLFSTEKKITSLHLLHKQQNHFLFK